MSEMQNHQQALIVVLSYVIGFITAFIMFGLVNDGKDIKEVSLNRLPEDMISDTENTNTSLSPAVMPTLEETEEGLFVQTPGGRIDIISAVTDSEVAEPGFHVAIIKADLPNSRFVHYCAQMDTASKACHHFIYSTEEHKTYLIKHENGTPLVTGNEEADSLFWTGSAEFSFGGKTASLESNWVLR